MLPKTETCSFVTLANCEKVTPDMVVPGSYSVQFGAALIVTGSAVEYRH